MQQLNQFEVNGTKSLPLQARVCAKILVRVPTGNSLERLQQYMVIEQEPPPVEDRLPPAYWPSSGELTVENLSARYSAVGTLLYLYG